MSIEELKRIAESATPGPVELELVDGAWKFKHPKIPRGFHGLCYSWTAHIDERDAKYIATFNPQLILKLLEQIGVMREALEFYAGAKILFISKDGKMAQAKNPIFGACSGLFESEVHIKDDGDTARRALSKIK